MGQDRFFYTGRGQLIPCTRVGVTGRADVDLHNTICDRHTCPSNPPPPHMVHAVCVRASLCMSVCMHIMYERVRVRCPCTYPVVAPDAGDDGRSEGPCGVHTGAGVPDLEQAPT